MLDFSCVARTTVGAAAWPDAGVGGCRTVNYHCADLKGSSLVADNYDTNEP